MFAFSRLNNFLKFKVIPGKISITTATKRLSMPFWQFFPFILADFCNFTPLCVVFNPSTTAASCQDADLFYS